MRKINEIFKKEQNYTWESNKVLHIITMQISTAHLSKMWTGTNTTMALTEATSVTNNSTQNYVNTPGNTEPEGTKSLVAHSSNKITREQNMEIYLSYPETSLVTSSTTRTLNGERSTETMTMTQRGKGTSIKVSAKSQVNNNAIPKMKPESTL